VQLRCSTIRINRDGLIFKSYKNERENMKVASKTIVSAIAIVLSFGATCAFSQGATSVYGSTRISFNSQRVGSGDDVRQVTDNASRLGFRGSETIGAGLEALYGYELSVTADNIGAGTPTALIGVRNAFVGIRGAFGTFAIGALDSGNPTGSPLYSQVVAIVSYAPGDAGATAIGTSILNARNRTPNSIGYQTPRMGDFVGRAR
jgi:predicted porin